VRPDSRKKDRKDREWAGKQRDQAESAARKAALRPFWPLRLRKRLFLEASTSVCSIGADVKQGGANHYRKVAKTLQHQAAAFGTGIQTTGTGSHHSDGRKADHELTIKLDQSVGAGQKPKIYGEGHC